jgi:N-ATPase, AtpR subunit
MSFAHVLDPLLIVTALAGCVLGLGYFAVLRRTLLMWGRRSSRRAVLSLTLARLATGTVFFLLVARLGAPALLTALGGFLLARTLAIRVERRVG